MVPFAATVFLSALLLFQVQPVIAKAILPWFGGTAAVWATCMVFFQVTLLAGYLYAHALITRAGARRQRFIHAGLLAAAALSLPITPSVRWRPVVGASPSARILLVLAITVGLPYLLLSTTGPLLQAWYTQQKPGAIPYRLFALSNAGSLLGLLSYPAVVEPYLSLGLQSWVWSAGFLVFAALCLFTGWRSLPRDVVPAASPGEDVKAPGPSDYALWILLAMCASMLLLTVTQHLAGDVASIPFLWVLPLSLYLLSFILSFDADGWYRRGVFLALLFPALGGMSYLIWTESEKPGMKWLIAIFCAAQFAVCMFCHGELARTKPHPRYLTIYFLMVSTGGALGGIFVGLIAPNWFNAQYEFPIALALSALLSIWVLVRDGEAILVDGLLGWRGITLMVLVAGLGGFLVRVVRDTVAGTMVVARNFYGELKVRQYNGVYDWDGYRVLIHGTINHGEEWTHPARRKLVSTYYCEDSGIGMVMAARVLGDPQRVGIIGLGTGTLAGYARPGDAYRFYDINPLVQQIANRDFWHLKLAEAQVEVVLGDARLSLEREENQRFNTLVVDAFSGDAIPVHLLTREALALYRTHLNADGILAVHISNRYIDLKPVLAAAGRELGYAVRLAETEDDGDKDRNCFGTTWVLMALNEGRFDRPEFQRASRMKVDPRFRLWTDDYSSILGLLR